MKRLLLNVPMSVIWLSATMALGPGASAQEFTSEQIAKFRQLFKEGSDHYDQQSYAKSNASFESLLKLLPKSELEVNSAMVLFKIGANHALMGNKDKAIETLGKAVNRGFWNSRALEAESDLASLRDADAFKALVKSTRTKLGSVAFGLKDLKGKELKKEDYEGKVLVIDIWGTWCPPCRMEIPHFVKLQKEYRKQGLEIIGLTWERRPPDDTLTQHVANFASQNEINYRLVMIEQDRLSLIPELSGFPTTLFVGRDGTVRERAVGYHPYDELRAKVTKLLKEPRPEKAPTATD